MAVKKVTKKRRVEVILPGQTEIYQPNRITNGKFQGFTLIQSKVLVCLIEQLQEAVKFSMAGRDFHQLELFKEVSENSIRVGLPLKEIAGPDHYHDVYAATEQIMKLSVKLPSPVGKEYISIVNFLSRVELPVKVKGISTIYVELYKDVAGKLVEIDKNLKGQPAFYTRYLYEVAMSASNKYTYKLYMIISSWKAKGGFRISLKELREQLGIGQDEYPRYYDFKQRVLLPIQKDLTKKADCWFNCRATDLEVRQDKSVVSLNFKIIVPEFQEEMKNKAENIILMLRTHFGFKEKHLARVKPLFDEEFTLEFYETIVKKLVDLSEHFAAVKNTDDKVNDAASYTVTSLLSLKTLKN